ncbi:hypothetical protein T484DRAFT_1779579, partial [Baffinella frigidus]
MPVQVEDVSVTSSEAGPASHPYYIPVPPWEPDDPGESQGVSPALAADETPPHRARATREGLYQQHKARATREGLYQ